MANSNHTNNHTRHDYAALVPAVTSKKSDAQDEVLSMATRQRGLHKMPRRWEIKPVFDFLLGKETRLSIQTLMYDGHIKSSGILARHLEKAWVIQNQENGLRSFCAVPPPPPPPSPQKASWKTKRWCGQVVMAFDSGLRGCWFNFPFSLESQSGGISV